MTSDEDMIKGWYGEIAFENDQQKRFMLDTGHLFEMFRENIVSAQDAANEIRKKYPPHILYSNDFLSNKALFSKLREHLTGMGLKPDPSNEVNNSTRIHIKVAYMVFPGKPFEKERSDSLLRFNNFLEGKENPRNPATKPATSTPQPQMSQQPTTSPDADIFELKSNMHRLQNQIDMQQKSFSDQLNQLNSSLCHQISKLLIPSSNTDQKSTFQQKESDENSFHNSSRVHHYISQRFKDKENKYSGNDEEDLFEFFISSETVADDYNMTEDQSLKFLHNLLRGEALRFFNQSVKNYAISYRDAKTRIIRHFNSADVQNRIKNELLSLNFDTFVEKEGSKTKALSSIAAYISNTSPKCPIAFRHESHRVEFLKKSLLKETWARTVLMDINDETTFQSLYTRLANALQFSIEVTSENESPHGELDKSKSNEPKPTIYFTQPKYARRIARKVFSGSSRDKICWNCGRKGHTHDTCHTPLDPVRIAAAKANFLEKKSKYRRPGMSASKQVLFELATELQEVFGGTENCDSDNPANVFFGKESDKSDFESSSDEIAQEDDGLKNSFYNMCLDDENF